MGRHRHHRLSLVLAALIAALHLPACGGGGGGGGGGGPIDPGPSISFTSSGAAGANSLSLAQGAGTGGTTLVLELRANAVSDLYGVAFDLTYPQDALAFDSAGEGTLLPTGQITTSLQATPGAGGRVIVGYTRLGPVPGASGSGVLLVLRFTVESSGSGAIGFSDAAAFDSEGRQQPAISWHGGSVSAVR